MGASDVCQAHIKPVFSIILFKTPMSNVFVVFLGRHFLFTSSDTLLSWRSLGVVMSYTPEFHPVMVGHPKFNQIIINSHPAVFKQYSQTQLTQITKNFYGS